MGRVTLLRRGRLSGAMSALGNRCSEALLDGLVELVGLGDDVGQDVVLDGHLGLDLATVQEDLLLGLVVADDDVGVADGVDGALPVALARGLKERVLGDAELANNGENWLAANFYTRLPNFETGIACAEEILSLMRGNAPSARIIKLTNVIEPKLEPRRH